MSIEFLFNTYTPLELISILVGILASVFIIGWGLSSRREDSITHRNLIVVVGFFLLLWSMIRYILPDVSVVDWTLEDLQFGFAYDFTRERSIRKALEIILGITFLMHGKDNRPIFWHSLSIGGLFLAVYQMLSAFNYGTLYYLLWFDNPTGLEYQSTLFVPIELVNIGILIASMIFILTFSFRNLVEKSNLIAQCCLVMYCVLYLIPPFLSGIQVAEILPGMSIGLVIGIGLILYFMRRGSNSQPVPKEVHD
jgi:hypothetical protein